MQVIRRIAAAAIAGATLASFGFVAPATADEVITVPPGVSTSVAAAAVGTPLYLNLGPVSRGVRVGTPQSVFQFVRAGAPNGAVVENMPVNFHVVSGANAGQRGVGTTNDIGQIIWRFSTLGADPLLGTTDVVSAWIDLNDNGVLDVNEPSNTNPFFTLPADEVNGVVACDGKAASIVLTGNNHVARGTGGPDVIAVYNDNSRVYAGDGDDVVCVYGSNNEVYLSGGNDRAYVGDGDGNVIYSGDGDDLVRAGQGDSTVYGGAGNDTAIVGDGRNTVWGGSGDDRLYAGDGPSQLSGDGGNDYLFAVGDAGTYWGGSGWDRFEIAGRTWNA